MRQKSDIRSFISGMVESEIYSEIGDQSVDDHVFLRVAERFAYCDHSVYFKLEMF